MCAIESWRGSLVQPERVIENFFKKYHISKTIYLLTPEKIGTQGILIVYKYSTGEKKSCWVPLLKSAKGTSSNIMCSLKRPESLTCLSKAFSVTVMSIVN